MDDLADLAELDQQLRRVGRNDEHVGVGLDEDAGLALVGFAQVFAGGDGLGNAALRDWRRRRCGVQFEQCRRNPAEDPPVGFTLAFGWIEAVDGLRQHQRQRVFARAARAGQDERMRKTTRANAFAQMRDGVRVAEKILKPTD